MTTTKKRFILKIGAACNLAFGKEASVFVSGRDKPVAPSVALLCSVEHQWSISLFISVVRAVVSPGELIGRM